MRSQTIEEVIDRPPNRVTQIELLAVGDHLTICNHLIQLFVHILNEVLRCSLQKQYLIIMISVVAHVAAFLADQLIVDDAEGNEWLQVELAHLLLLLPTNSSVIVL